MLLAAAEARPLSDTAPASRSSRAASPARAQAALLIGAVLFGSMAVATRAASSELPPAQIAFVRFFLNLLGVIVWAVVQPRRWRATRPGLLFLRGLFGGLAVLLYFTAISELGAGMGTLLNYTFPLWATLFAALFLGESVGARLGIGMVLTTVGLVIVVGPHEVLALAQGVGDPELRLGLIAGLVSSLLGGAATTVIRAVRQTDSALTVFASFCGIGALACLPGAIATWQPISMRAAWLLVLVAACSFAAQMLFTWALRWVRVGTGALTTQLTVVASWGLASLFLGEEVTLAALLGGGLVLSGVVLAAARRA